MSHYVPDAWVIVKVSSPRNPTFYRVFAGWYGGFVGSDSWKLNSGITEIEDMGKYYNIFGQTGSCYQCYKDIERMTGYMSSLYAYWLEDVPEGYSFEHINFSELPADLIF
jgi:hypothetical protein